MKIALSLLACVLGLTICVRLGGVQAPLTRAAPTAVVGDPSVIEARYERWKAAREASGERDVLDVGLAWSRGMSSEFTTIRGSARFDLARRTIAIDLSGLDDASAYDAWLVENVPGPARSVAPEPGDRLERVGTFRPRAARAAQRFEIQGDPGRAFHLDLVVITRAGRTPAEEALAVGTPSLFERTWSRERDVRRTRDTGFLLAVTAIPPAGGGTSALAALVAEGEELFFQETFAGNGRTCGTCHPAENDLTLDRAFIAALPPTDPLFRAEQDVFPDLNSSLNGGRFFEIPELMHTQALILENLDGFGDLVHRYVMRSVSHVFAQSVSIQAAAGALNPPQDRTGWGGDGAPDHGTLRDFATGAVRQHFTQTLARQAGIDFRLPTDHELDALEAFQLSLGRQADFQIATMVFGEPRINEGRDIFEGVGRCSVCHFNAGANDASGNNLNFDTGVERLLRNHPDPLIALRPPDGGFGTTPQGTFEALVPNPETPPVGTPAINPFWVSFGDKTFNVQSLVEAADTLPAFHNNVTTVPSATLVNTIEGAIRFYSTAEFNASPAAAFSGPIQLNQTEVAKVGFFLRALNALDNIRESRARTTRAWQEMKDGIFDPIAVDRLLVLAAKDCFDARDVLLEVGLLNGLPQFFPRAERLIQGARSGTLESRLACCRLADRLLLGAKKRIQLAP